MSKVCIQIHSAICTFISSVFGVVCSGTLVTCAMSNLMLHWRSFAGSAGRTGIGMRKMNNASLQLECVWRRAPGKTLFHAINNRRYKNKKFPLLSCRTWIIIIESTNAKLVRLATVAAAHYLRPIHHLYAFGFGFASISSMFCFTRKKKEVKLIVMWRGGAAVVWRVKTQCFPVKGDERETEKQKWCQRTGKRNGRKSNEELFHFYCEISASSTIFRGATNSCKRNGFESRDEEEKREKRNK